jgi:hypothetical protein
MVTTLKSPQGLQNLYGNATVSAMVLQDVDDTDALLFVFTDLSVRSQGLYTLCCQLINIKE